MFFFFAIPHDVQKSVGILPLFTAVIPIGSTMIGSALAVCSHRRATGVLGGYLRGLVLMITGSPMDNSNNRTAATRLLDLDPAGTLTHPAG